MAEQTAAHAGFGHFLIAGGVGTAAAVGFVAGFAALMARHGLPASLAGPLATASVCMGSALSGWLYAMFQRRRSLACGAGQGTMLAFLLLVAQGTQGTVPLGGEWVRLGMVVLAGALGGALHALLAGKRTH